MKKLTIFILSALAVCGYAQDNTKQEKGLNLVFGVHGGKSFMYGDIAKSETNRGVTVSGAKPNGTVGFSVGLEQPINNKLSAGIESGFQYFDLGAKQITSGTARIGKIDMNMYSIPVMLKFKYSFQEDSGLNLFVKGGMAFNRITIDAQPLRPANTSTSDSSFQPVVAIGLGYEINNFNLYAQFQYNRISLSDLKVDGDVKTLSGGISYTLPM